MKSLKTQPTEQIEGLYIIDAFELKKYIYLYITSMQLAMKMCLLTVVATRIVRCFCSLS